MDNYDKRLRDALIEQHGKLFDYDKKCLKNEHAEYINCPVCDSNDHFVYFEKDYFTFSQCNKCSMVYLNPRLNNRATYDFYNSKWTAIYNEKKFDTKSDSTVSDDKINLSNLVEINRISKSTTKGKLLEIGSGNGYFLRKAKEAGYDIYGVELNEANFAKTFDEFGKNIFNKDLFEIHFNSNMFDVIYMRDVFEHVPNPKKMLQELNRIAKQDCILYIEVPNIEGLIYKIAKEKHVCVFGFEHLNYWSPDTLSKILESSGFQVEEVLHESLDFSIRYVTSYLTDQQFTAIRPVKMNSFLKYLLKLIRYIFSMEPLRTIDKYLFPRLANILRRGSVMKVIARKL